MHQKHRIGIRIKEIRKLRGLSQEDLADMSGRSVDAISNIERGLNAPSVATLEKLAECLGVSFTELMGTKGKTKVTDPKRLKLETVLVELSRKLDVKTLAVAVKQVEALARNQDD